MAQDHRSELAIKRDEWFASDEGKNCCRISNLGLPPSQMIYLRNRLETAFIAGAKASGDVAEELAAKVQRSIDASYEC